MDYQATMTVLLKVRSALRGFRTEKATELANDIEDINRDFGNNPDSESVQERIQRIGLLTMTYLSEGRLVGVTEHVGKLRGLFQRR